jgi:hypothetical protein
MAKLIKDLYTIPKPEKGYEEPHFHRYANNQIQQADLLSLPSDAGRKYLLVVVDLGSHFTDAEPLKSKTSKAVLEGFKAIYKRGVLDIPREIDFDQGSEFKADVKEWFEHHGSFIHVAKPYRHRQQGMVERRNQLIGKKLFEKMMEEELATGIPCAEWVDELPDILEQLNDKEKKRKIEPPDDDYHFTKFSADIIPEGTKVRVALDAPLDTITRKPLHGKFREYDFRWEIKPREVKQVILEPNEPPLYLVSDDKGGVDHSAAHTKNQLQVVNPLEVKPKPKERKEKQTFWVVDKLKGKKTIKGKVFYLVHWKGFSDKDDTWEPQSNLLEDIPAVVKRYEAQLAKKKLK